MAGTVIGKPSNHARAGRSRRSPRDPARRPVDSWLPIVAGVASLLLLVAAGLLLWHAHPWAS